MAYNNGFPMNYPYYPTQPNAYPTQMNVASAQPAQNGIIWVQGEAGAKSYLVAPNNTVQLWDSESQTIYLKSADASGMPSMRILDYKIRSSDQQVQKIGLNDGYVTQDELNNIKNEISRLKDELDKIKEVKHDEHKHSLTAGELSKEIF